MRQGEIRLSTNALYGLTAHELAHVSHANHSPVHFLAYGAAMIGESWATAVEWGATRHVYPFQVLDEPDRSRPEIIGVPGSSNYKYSPMFIDMRDATNQRNLNAGNTDWVDDRISFIQWNTMQDIIGGATGLNSLANRIPNHTSVSQADADRLIIDFYQDIQDNH